jgi:hypothetical protein
MTARRALRGQPVPAFGGSLEDSEVRTVFGVERFNPVTSVQDGMMVGISAAVDFGSRPVPHWAVFSF